MSDIVEKAARTLDELWGKRFVPGSIVSSGDEAGALDAAGLLVSEFHVAALEAVEEYARAYAGDAGFMAGTPAYEVLKAGRASLESKKPKKSWCANGSELWLNGGFHTRFCTHAEARAVAAALNAMEVSS